VHGVQSNGEFSVLRDRKQFGIFQVQFARTRIVHARHVELIFTAIPGGAVDHAAVGSEAGVADGTGAKCDLFVLGQSHSAATMA
jgi:hypothetical protein